MDILKALRQTVTSIKTWADNKFLKKTEAIAEDFGVYVQDTEPTNAVDGDIWIDTASNPSYIQGETQGTTPNFKALTFRGAVTGVYDGTSALEIRIPEAPSKTSELINDSGFMTDYVETDPTVPAWAKTPSKPTYSKSEVGLENVDNVQQYSADNPPPYPVTSVNEKTGAITISELPHVTESDNGKVLMVVNGAWTVVDINLSVDANGVLLV